MTNFFSKFKIIFYFLNVILIFLYLFPGSLLGIIIYDNKNIQPQLTPDFFISSNHFYVFTLISIIGFLSFIKKKHIRLLAIYLILLSIILETFHLIIPERSFEWSDLLGNLLGVFIVIISNILIKKYGYFKK
jgi:VanZ family protein|tara:strand:+ start:466 stop:861 length:396 start_codon:yes stop_codon:yes gene_type:complete